MAVNMPEGKLEEVSKETFSPPKPQKSRSRLFLEEAHLEKLQSAPATLSFRNITYTVPNSLGDKDLILLDNVSGFAMPGRITAIMGITGAGKTTLLDVLSGRKPGATGEIYANEHPKTDETWSRLTGYVEQFDSHSSNVTVREAVQFSGLMRLDRERWTTGIEGEW